MRDSPRDERDYGADRRGYRPANSSQRPHRDGVSRAAGNDRRFTDSPNNQYGGYPARSVARREQERDRPQRELQIYENEPQYENRNLETQLPGRLRLLFTFLFQVRKTFRLVKALVTDPYIERWRKALFFALLGALILIMIFPELVPDVLIPFLDPIGIPVELGIDLPTIALMLPTLLKVFPTEILMEHYYDIFGGSEEVDDYKLKDNRYYDTEDEELDEFGDEEYEDGEYSDGSDTYGYGGER